MKKETYYTNEEGKEIKVIKWYDQISDTLFLMKDKNNDWSSCFEKYINTFYHLEQLKKGIQEKKDIIIVENEDDTEILEKNDFVATNLLSNCFSDLKEIELTLQSLKGAGTVYIVKDYLDTLCTLKFYNEDISEVFLKILSNLVENIRIIELKDVRTNKSFYEVSEILDGYRFHKDGKEVFKKILENYKEVK